MPGSRKSIRAMPRVPPLMRWLRTRREVSANRERVMIRIVLFLVSVGLIALGVVWFADRPGEVSVVWLGYRIETSIFVAALAVILFSLAIIIVLSVGRA